MTIMGAPGVPVTALEFDLADRMRKALRITGLSNREMAEYLGVSESSVSKWLAGSITPKRMALRMWAMRTGVPLEWLETGNAPRPEEGPEGDGVHPLGLEPRTHWLRAAPPFHEGNAWLEEEAA